MSITQLVILCRPGFEAETAAEIQAVASGAGCFGYCKTQSEQGWVSFVADELMLKQLIEQVQFRHLIFARQWFLSGEVIELSSSDRVGDFARNLDGIPVCGEVELIHTDTNDGKELSRLCKSLTPPLAAELRKTNHLTQKRSQQKPRLMIMLLNGKQALLGYHLPRNAAPWPDGICHLKFPKAAPSRSTLKLEEAWHWFIPKHEWKDRLRASMTAVDLGAAPGGWTWQLVKQHMMVSAIDNGPMKGDLMESGQVTHLLEDGFRYHPSKPVHWMVCDMAESPIKVADRMADWIINKWCKEAIFNLKLPMKKRYHEVTQCIELMQSKFDAAGIEVEMNFKHLYHDREEITGHARRV